MNPLTQVKNLQKITARETAAGVSDEASWHAKYKDSAYIFVGGLPYELTEGDLLAVFSQYGEIMDVNLVRDKATGKSRGFAFLAYEDQRSTVLAVDNLNGARVASRTLRVDHVGEYKRVAPETEEEEEERKRKREEAGVCRAFQRGECSRGDRCRFSHDPQRCADTGWGPKEEQQPLRSPPSHSHAHSHSHSRAQVQAQGPVQVQASVRGHAPTAGTALPGDGGSSRNGVGAGGEKRERERDAGERRDSRWRRDERGLRRGGIWAGEEMEGREEDGRGRNRASEGYREDNKARNERDRKMR